MYEISYNALIKDNLFVRNAIGMGATNPGFPTSALYISESGSDSRVHSKYGSSFQITGNMFINNWSGVILWENANRFCGSPDNSSTGVCTLVAPEGGEASRRAAGGICTGQPGVAARTTTTSAAGRPRTSP